MADVDPETRASWNKLLNKQYYGIISEPAGDPEDIEEMRSVYKPAHHEWLSEMESKGVLFAAGAFFDENHQDPAVRGAVALIVVRAESFEEATKIADSDPLHKAGVRKYTLRAWRVNEGSYSVTVKYSDQSMTIE